MRTIFPFLTTLRDYKKAYVKYDIIAGLTVGVVLIPQAIAYALLMGTPPIYGLYACLLPLVLYAFFGTSTQLSIGPVAITGILVMSGVSHLAAPFSPEFINLVLFCGLLIGVTQILMGVLRMGFLVNLISQPVITGFISAAAIIIIISQLQPALGITIPKTSFLYQKIKYLLFHLTELHGITAGLCLFSVIVMYVVKKYKPQLPGALLVLVLTTAITYIMQLDQKGVAIIADVPSSLPSFNIPTMGYETMIALLPTVLTVTFIGYVGSIGIAKSLEMKTKDHIIRPNQELFALGIAKIIGAFFMAIPSSGSYSRSAINNEVGGKTTVATMISAALVLFSLLFFTSFFYYIPKAVLAAIILVSVFGLINIKEAAYLLTLRRRDFIVMMITFLGTLIFGVENGIFIGVILSFIFLQYYSSRPHMAELVNIPNTVYYRNRDRFPDASQSQKYLIIRFDDQLYFGNASYFKDAVLSYIDHRDPRPPFLILVMTNIHDIDSTGIHILEDICHYLEELEVQLLLSGTIGPVRDFLKRSGFTDKLGVTHFFMTITDAVAYAEDEQEFQDNRKVVSQFNTQRSFLD